MSDPNPPARGLVAGKYELSHLIGRGGMGSVWEGRHATLGTRVAIKFVDAEYADSPEARQRFMTEARAAATIQSKYAIQIHDHGLTDDGRPYIVMELLVGEPLDRRIERVGRLALSDTARILGQVCRALQRAHEAGIIHRDLKPENIFLVRSPDDDDEIAKVLDFGIAKFRASPGEAGLSSSTKTGAVLGTPFYMSPEQARGLRNIDHRTDLWSLGIIAYKCVTGVLPFDGESVGDLLVKICTGPLPVPSLVVAGLPPAFDGWFARSLERAPERRFASASELSSALAMAAGVSQRAHSGRSHEASFPSGVSPHASSARLKEVAPRATPVVSSQPFATPPAAGVTSAPFTASASPAGSSRGIWAGIVAAAVLGGTLGVVGVARLVSPRSTPTTVTGASVDPVRAARATPPPEPIPSASASAGPPAPVTTLVPMASPGAPSSAPHTQGVPPSSPARRSAAPVTPAKPPGGASTGSPPGASPASPPQSTKTSSSTSKPSMADPGY
jgi:eukaryotic-like serine/threonine-protein kinase